MKNFKYQYTYKTLQDWDGDFDKSCNDLAKDGFEPCFNLVRSDHPNGVILTQQWRKQIEVEDGK